MKKNICIISLFSMLFAGCSGTKPTLGIVNSKFVQCPSSPNCVSTQAKDAKHFIEPIVIESATLEVKKTLQKTISAFKRSKIVEVKDDYIRAEFSSKIFGFVDDVEFYFPQTSSQKTTVQIRSASRVGYSDLDVNRKRIEEIRTKINEGK